MTIVTSLARPVPTHPTAPRYRSWQAALRDAVRDPGELCRILRLPVACRTSARRATGDFPLLVPRSYIARMRIGDPRDPLLLQVMPRSAETDAAAGFTPDPVGDLAATCHPGMIAKYAGRVLLITTGACAVHCRYCFRRHYPYSDGPRSLKAWSAPLAELSANASIREVILSGGDPLMLVDRHLLALADRIAGMAHVERLRIHTRLPIMVPQRVTQRLRDWIRTTRVTPIVVVHANHAAELDADVGRALKRLTAAGALLLNQAVLLAGVNDTTDALAALCERLIQLRVQPYYLHQLDRVAGAAHFEVPVSEGRRLIDALRGRLPGYAVPRYVRDAGGSSKDILA